MLENFDFSLLSTRCEDISVQKFWLNSLLFSPAILSLLMVAVPTMGSEIPATNQPSSFSSTESIGQVTSVSQLSDVNPTDWATAVLQATLTKLIGVIVP